MCCPEAVRATKYKKSMKIKVMWIRLIESVIRTKLENTQIISLNSGFNREQKPSYQ